MILKWILRISRLRKYAELSAIVKTEAAAAGLCPAEYQAVIWHETIRAYGKKPRSYLGVRDRHQKYFEFYLEFD